MRLVFLIANLFVDLKRLMLMLVNVYAMNINRLKEGGKKLMRYCICFDCLFLYGGMCVSLLHAEHNSVACTCYKPDKKVVML